MFGTPKVWLFGFGLAALAMVLGATHIRYMWTVNRISTAAKSEGESVVTARQVKTVLITVTKAAEEERKAEAEIPLVTVSDEIKALCKRSASCIERGQFR